MTGENSSSAAVRETAGSHMVCKIPRATAETTVKTVIKSLQGEHFECADTVFVIDAAGRLEGIVRINDLLANGDRPIGEIMVSEYDGVRSDDDQEQISGARHPAEHDCRAGRRQSSAPDWRRAAGSAFQDSAR